MTTNKIGIIGNGNVGSALARGLENKGNEVRTVGDDDVAVRETAAWADILFLAVPYVALDQVVGVIGDIVSGVIVVDVTNALDAEMKLALGYSTSGAEKLQEKLPGAHVVKAFNTVFAGRMATGHLGQLALTAFVAGDEQSAKSTVLSLASDIGFDAIDAGPLANARLLEPLGYFNIQLGYMLGMGVEIGFKLLHD